MSDYGRPTRGGSFNQDAGGRGGGGRGYSRDGAEDFADRENRGMNGNSSTRGGYQTRGAMGASRGGGYGNREQDDGRSFRETTRRERSDFDDQAQGTEFRREPPRSNGYENERQTRGGYQNSNRDEAPPSRGGSFQRDGGYNNQNDRGEERSTRGAGQRGGYGSQNFNDRGDDRDTSRGGQRGGYNNQNERGDDRYARGGGQRGGYGNQNFDDRGDATRGGGQRNGYQNQNFSEERPTRGGMNGSSNTRGAGNFSEDRPTRGAMGAARGGYGSREQNDDRGGYGETARGGRNQNDYDNNQSSGNDYRREPRSNDYDNNRSSRGGYQDRETPSARGAAFSRGGNYGGGADRGDDRAPRGGRGGGGYQNFSDDRPPRGGMGGNPRGGGYGNRDQEDDRSYGATTRGRGHSYGGGGNSNGYDRPSYGNENDNNEPSSFGNPRGGSFSGGRGGGGGGRYEDRRNEDNGGGYKGYSGYSGYGQQEDGRKEFTEENHAPRDYKPVDRDVEDIFAEDREDVERNTATIFDADADVLVEETDEQLTCDNWEELELDEQLMANIASSDYVKPRKIQQKTIPYVLAGYDVKCQGETGSGKTAAFLIPIVQKLLEQSHEGQLPRSNPVCLIIAPTRELVSQIFEQAKKFVYKTSITVARAYGEYAVRTNLVDIRNGCNILVACIGRLMHFVRNGELGLRDLKYLVLDEADRLLMENFNSDVLQLFQWPEMPKGDDRQTLLFSATLRDPVVMELTRQYLRPKSVLITVQCQSNKRVLYKVFAVPSAPAKYKYLVKYMKKITEENDGVCPRVLIFVNRKVNTDRVAIECTTNQFPATTIHGDRGQHLREEALRSFRTGKTKCLVATDVCARGVDIKEMDHVINYDLPTEEQNFVQRCGRTGRVKNGVAMSFYLEDEDRSISSTISNVIQQNGQEPPQFLLSSVSPADYNFGEGEVVEEQSYGGDQSYGGGNNEASSSYDANNQENGNPSNSDGPPGLSNPGPESAVIADPHADDGWD